MRECYSVSRSLIDENNGSVGRSWIVVHHGIVAKLSSAAEIQLLFKERLLSSIQLVFNLIQLRLCQLESFFIKRILYCIVFYVLLIIQLLLSKELFQSSQLLFKQRSFS